MKSNIDFQVASFLQIVKLNVGYNIKDILND